MIGSAKALTLLLSLKRPAVMEKDALLSIIASSFLAEKAPSMLCAIPLFLKHHLLNVPECGILPLLC